MGRRMGGAPKQFRLLDGRPALCWAARPLLEALAGPLVVVLPAAQLEEGTALLAAHLGAAAGRDFKARIQVAAGGVRRQDSVRAGLAAVKETPTVLIHDASRPFASTGLVERVARKAAEGCAVVPVVPIHDTLKEVDGPWIVRTHDRSRFMAAQTPQGFPVEVIRRVHVDAGGIEATDDAALCEAAGVPVAWIPGEPLNRKLTGTDDWAWAEEMVAAGRVGWTRPGRADRAP
ncbi:hypothetical protein BH18GEM1_BH18GEM1_05190 [soil metagenome]